MAGNVTANSTALIRAQLYSEFLLEAIHEGLLPDGLFRNVSDFGDGTTLNIPTLGEAVLRDYVEGQAAVYDAIDSGNVTLTITEYVQAGSAVTRKLQQDGYKAAALEAMIPREHLRLIQERFETDMLAVIPAAQTAGATNAINNFAHRWVADSGSTAGVISYEDFVYAKLAFDKCKIPDQGRIAIVDPIVEASITYAFGPDGLSSSYNNPQFQGMVETGFAQSHKFLRHIQGFDVWTSNRLPTVTDTINGGPHGGSETVTNGKANLFMSVLDDQHMPIMGAWRQLPKVDGEFNKDLQQDEYITTARWGFGAQRLQAAIAVLTSASAYK